MTISELKHLIGLKVVFRVKYDNEVYKDILGIVSSACIDTFHFFEKRNEPMYASINFKPIDDKKVYDNISKDEYYSIFEDTYYLNDIVEIIN